MGVQGRFGVLGVLTFAVVLAWAAIASAAPVTIPNDVAPAAQFNVTGAETELHAHGGGMIKHGDNYYWYGEWRNPNSTINRVPVYRSTDLKNWEYRGAALAGSEVSHLTSPNVERPKVIYNAATGNFVMWMHLELNGNYNSAHAAVAVSTTGPEGPFIWQWNGRIDRPVTGAAPSSAGNGPPHMSRDMTVFVDDNAAAYLISSVDDNRDLHIYRLTDDYTDVAPTGHYLVWNDQWREAPIVFKRNGVYFLLTSGATGWSPNQQSYATSTNIAGGAASWTQSSGISFANQSAFETQGAHFITVQGTEATSYLYLADRWAGSFNGGNPNNSQYVWLPLEFPTPTSVEMPWADEISVDTDTGVVTGRQNDPPEGIKWPVTNLAVGSTSDADQGPHHPFVHGNHFNNAANLVDGRQETNWISTGTQANAWAQLDLGDSRPINHLRLMLFRGGVRTYQLEVLAGPTPGELTSVWTGTTPRKTGFHEISFPETSARYIRVRTTGAGTGDTSNENRMVPGSSLGIVEAEAYLTGVENGNCEPLRSDEFSGSSLNGNRWSFHHPTTPATGPNAPEVADGKLRLRAVQGELPDGNISFVGQPLPPGDHWTVTTKIDFNPNAGWQHAGIMLYADNNNLARITFTRNSGNGQRFFELVSHVNGDKTQSAAGNLSNNHGNSAIVRLTRNGNQLSARYQGRGAFYSAQGGVWLPQGKPEMSTFLGSVNLTTDTRTGAGARIGPYAAGGVAGDANPIAEFDYFQVGPDDEYSECGPDTEPPVSNVVLSPAQPDGNDGWYRTAPTVNFSATDNRPGPLSVEYRLGTTGAFLPHTAPFQVTEEGTDITVQHHASDGAGNVEETKTFSWKHDGTPPATTHEYQPPTLNPPSLPSPELPGGRNSVLYDHRYDVDAEDELSGIASTTHCIGTAAAPCNPTTPVTNGLITVSGLGEHLVRYRSTDVAGNQETIREFPVEIVEHPHTLSIHDLPASRTFGSAALSFNVETSVYWPLVIDTPPTVEASGPCTVGATGTYDEDWGWPVGLSITGAGTCVISASHVGAPGLIEPAETVSQVIKIAKAKPKVKLTVKPKKVKSGKKAKITVQVSGPGTKAGKVKIKVGGKTKTVKVKANGKATYKVKVSGKRGKKIKVQATYNASTNLASAKSNAVKITLK